MFGRPSALRIRPVRTTNGLIDYKNVQPLWGETHLHTLVSVDAGTMTILTQEDAFRFARGEEVTTTHGLRAKLSRSLDVLVIADHVEMYGLMRAHRWATRTR